MGNLGLTEILVIAFVAFLILGPEKMPKYGRILGETLQSLKKGLNDFKEEVTSEVSEPLKESENSFVKDIGNEMTEIKKTIDATKESITEAIKRD